MAMKKGYLCKLWLIQSLSPSSSLTQEIPQQDPFSTPTSFSKVSHRFPQTRYCKREQHFHFKSNLLEKNSTSSILLPKPELKNCLFSVTNTKVASPKAFFKGVVFAAHLL